MKITFVHLLPLDSFVFLWQGFDITFTESFKIWTVKNKRLKKTENFELI